MYVSIMQYALKYAIVEVLQLWIVLLLYPEDQTILILSDVQRKEAAHLVPSFRTARWSLLVLRP